jgi:uncharacterized protein (DUF302 family)
MASVPDNGLIHLSSRYPVSETLTRLETILQEHSLTIFARIDHSGEAEKAGLEMRPTQLLIFGRPVGGTPLMVAAPTVAIDLPLKALVWEDTDGKAWLSYNRPDYLQRRHNVPEELIKNIAGVGGLLKKAVE